MSYYFNRNELEVIRDALWNSYMELYQFKPAIITQDNVQRLELVRRASTVRSEAYNYTHWARNGYLREIIYYIPHLIQEVSVSERSFTTSLTSSRR